MYIEINFNIEKEQFEYSTDIKENELDEILWAFLRNKCGQGADNSLPETRTKYDIYIELNLTDDSFNCKHNCGNLGLRDGILLKFLEKRVSQ